MRIWPLIILFGVLLASARAQAGSGGSSIGVSAVGGTPELLGLQVRYAPSPTFQVGAGFGMLPINSVLQRQVTLNPVPVALSSGGPYNIYPAANYSMNSFSFLARWFPGEGHFFTQLGVAILSASGSMNGDIRNESTAAVSSGALNGSLRISQPVASLSVGWEYQYNGGFFFNFGLGASYLLKTTYTLNLGGSVSSLAPLDPVADQEFEKAKSQIRSQVEDGVHKLQEASRFLPSLFLNVGWSFDLR